MPAGGKMYLGAGTQTGAIKIKLPKNKSNAMFKFRVRINGHSETLRQSNEEYIVKGYNFSSGFGATAANINQSQQVTVVKDNFDTNSSISENINRLKTLADTQDKKDALEISGMVLDGLQYVEDADTTYIKRIDRTITDSNINPNLKRMVKDGVSLANASALLWNGDAVR